MAERSQYQYTPLVGPVWREPVAEKLGWLPEGQQPARVLPPNRLGDFVQPNFQALYNPEGLQWFPSARYAGRALARAAFDAFVFQRPIVAAAYDPQNLEWMPGGSYPRIPVELRRVGDFSQPVFQALYQPEGMQWALSGQRGPQRLPAIYAGGWVCDPTTPAALVTTPPAAIFYPGARAAFNPAARGTFNPGHL